MTAPVNIIRWRPALVALVLGLAALLRALPAPHAAADPGDAFLASAHVLCLGGEPSDGDVPPSPSHYGCDSCCLPGGRVAIILPDNHPVVILPPQLEQFVEVPGVLFAEARAPPFEAWSLERAQRGPPLRLIA